MGQVDKTSVLTVTRDSLRQLEPISSLSNERIDELVSLSYVEHINMGVSLFREGDVDNQTIYVLNGDVQLKSSSNKKESTISSKSKEGHYPLDDSQPRQFSAVAMSSVDIVRIDNSVLDYMMMWDQLAVAELSESSSAASGENSQVEKLVERAVLDSIEFAKRQGNDNKADFTKTIKPELNELKLENNSTVSTAVTDVKAKKTDSSKKQQDKTAQQPPDLNLSNNQDPDKFKREKDYIGNDKNKTLSHSQTTENKALNPAKINVEADNKEVQTTKSKASVVSEKDDSQNKAATAVKTVTLDKTATAAKTATPDKTATAAKTVTPDKTATAVKTVTPDKTATAEKTATPDKTATAEKTATPDKTATAEKNATPDKTATAEKTTTNKTDSENNPIVYESRDWIRKIRQIMAFKNMPPANVKNLLEKMESVNVKKGDRIIEQGGDGDYYYIVTDGTAVVTRTIELATLSSGTSFGEEALVAKSPRNASVSMTSDGILMRLSKKDFDELLIEPLMARVSADEARTKVLKGAKWLDVRHAKEFHHSRLPGAINIPLHELRLRMTELDKDSEYICCCRTGARSSSGSFLLAQNGFKVSVLTGGIQVMSQDLRR